MSRHIVGLVRKASYVVILIGVVTGTTQIQAVPMYGGDAALHGYNEVSPLRTLGTVVFHSQSQRWLHSQGQLSGSLSYTGLDGNWNTETMVVDYQGKASSSGITGLKASASGLITNAFFNPANDPYVIDHQFNIDPNGIPQSFGVSARAWAKDTLTIVGAQNLSYITFQLHLDGILSALHAVSAIQVDQDNKNLFFENVVLPYGASNKIINQTLVSNPIQVVGGSALLDFLLRVNVNLPTNTGSTVSSGTADFFNTLSFGTVFGFDSNGNPVDLVSIASSDGFSYAVHRVNDPPTTSVVSEPSALVLLLSGMLGLGFVRRAREGGELDRLPSTQ